jgi:SAM-dependent methyltransferase
MNRLHHWCCRSNLWKQKLEDEILPWSLNGADLGEEVLEIGPGPGLTTDWLGHRYRNITCLEADPRLALSLRKRTADTNITVRLGDATAMPFRDQTFSGVVSFTMLHHIPSFILQDRLFAEVYRVLKPGGVFAGTDSTWSLRMRIFHFGDTMVLVDPAKLPARLEAAGFQDVRHRIRLLS